MAAEQTSVAEADLATLFAGAAGWCQARNEHRLEARAGSLF